LVNVAIPDTLVVALSVLEESNPPPGPLKTLMVTVSPATGSPTPSSTVTLALVAVVALVSEGSVLNVAVAAGPEVTVKLPAGEDDEDE
jgi:hypothetical protein